MKGGRIKRRAPTITDRLVRTAERQKPEQISIVSPRPVSDGHLVAKRNGYHGPKITHHATKNHFLGVNTEPTTKHGYFDSKNGYYDAKTGYHDAKIGFHDVNKTYNGSKTYVSGLSTTALSTTALRSSTTALRSSTTALSSTIRTTALSTTALRTTATAPQLANDSNLCMAGAPETGSDLCVSSLSVSKAQQHIINELEHGELIPVLFPAPPPNIDWFNLCCNFAAIYDY